ncbi:hypothetical protein L7Q45_002501 [Citrobacter braakii]|nr:hypothetical protein [Citrobacter braakii]EIV2908190.1 hypothetical protein [Citrobacter braakii]
MNNGKAKMQAGRLFDENFDATGITLLPIDLLILIDGDVISAMLIDIRL